jgi:signal transduction histidine kinase/energy-coupling factor transporter ATP-binding protein EcfA2
MARYALVIGIARYDNFRNLDKAATDAAAIAHLFQTQGRYQVEPLPKRLVEAENRWELATDKKLTGKDLGQTLETFLLEQAIDQEALIYFAGHGFEVLGLGRKQKGYLATSDSTSDGRNAILFSDLNDLIRESSLSSLVLILDCCHAGSFLERTVLESTLTAFKEKKDYYLITACRSFERAREREEHGVFTAAVLKGLQADNADNEGTVTGDRLFDFVQRELRQSGQEPIRAGMGRSITLMNYQPQAKTVTAIVDENGEVICPYQGLQAFTAAQREFFFGRKRIVEAIKQNLEQQPFVPVIGASGSGKSSVVRAGLMPWLAESGWRILEPIKPGFEPLAALRAVFEPFFKRSRSEIQTLHQLIARDSTGLSSVIERLPGDNRYLLVVDQFEEMFTVCANEAERRRFIELITQVVEMQNSRLAVVTTMRADFLEPCLHYPALHHLIQSQVVLMPPLTGIDLRDAITEPAKRQGYMVEEALLLQILEDVGKEPGFLPLLEFALTKLWEKRDTENYLLTLEQYEKLGGLTGALNLHAERVYHYRDYEAESPADNRDEQEQEWIKRIFLRLVRTGEGDRDTRQRQPKAKLLAIAGDDPERQDAFWELLDGEGGLVQGRLLTAGKNGEGTNWIDLAHEALIDSWQKFSVWRKEQRELRRLSDRLEDIFREWQKNPSNENLMMGGLLLQVRENWQILETEMGSAEKEYFQRSVAYDHDRFAQLQQAVRAKENFLTAISHELRTPLNVILGFTRLIAIDSSTISKQQEYLEIINSSGEHLLLLINRVLDMSKIDASQLGLEITENVNVIYLCESSLNVVKEQAIQRKVQLKMDLQLNLNEISVDERRLRQVLINLLNNAIKFTPTGGQVTLNVYTEMPEDYQQGDVCSINTSKLLPCFLYFSVSDTGIGIAPENLHKLFQPFVQIDNNLNSQPSGIGLGLSISHEIIKLHGGDIRVESAGEGKGSTFTVILPITNSSDTNREEL